MSLQWMDNFSIYGTDAGRDARLLNGVYADATRIDLVVDPDPTAGGTYVAQAAGAGLGSVLRKVLTGPQTTVGVAGRFWLPSLPANATQHPIVATFRDNNNNVHLAICVNPAGYIEVYRCGRTNVTGMDFYDGSMTLIATSAAPCIVANAWQHVESKVFFDAAAGTIEVRREGVTVLNVAGIRTINNAAGVAATCSQAGIGNSDSGPNNHCKDLIIWDGTGTRNNNFMGSCQVMKIIPNADIALNWTPSGGATGYNLINEGTPDDDVNYISAPYPAPAAYKCGLSDLPTTVTSVRAVMPIHRSRKTDGGDGNIQIGLISGGTTGLGADRPITTAYTYWWDVYDADPATAGAWSRVAVNALNLQLNRTL